MKLSQKIIFNLILSIIILVVPFCLVGPVHALDATDRLFFGGQATELQLATGLGSRDPREVIALIIRVILGFLGILAVMIIMLAGFKWMTAGGDEDRISDARKTLFSALIGLILILASLGIAEFFIQAISTATGSNPI